jgi:proton-translocating NADH-quinone oxidoreductase chain L
VLSLCASAQNKKNCAYTMYLLIVFLPLLGFLSAALFGRFIGAKGAVLITNSCLFFTHFLCQLAFMEVVFFQSPCYIKLGDWFYSDMFDASWGFLFDSLTVVMLLVVTGVSSLVHMYSASYMGEDPHLARFMSYLSLFTFFMLMLVTSDNFLQMFFGWEGVGLASFLLINFWYTRIQANKSAIKAMLVNRVGDFGLALGIMALFSLFKSVDFATVFASAHHFVGCTLIFCNFEFNALTSICVLLFIGAVGKSAQLGLHTWLPDAMEGPTPVSALIHAATMVTAGVFMIARCSPIFEYSPNALCIVTFAGALTSFFAATTGVVQNDLKRVIAYSTCSQLGYMVFACGLSQYSVGVFHLMNHAAFKALLFLSAGAVIHAVGDEQDMRKMGGLVKLLPFTYSMMLIGSLALTGTPFLTGFYSKDVILEVAFAKYTVHGNFAYWLGSLSALFTSYYSWRLLFMTFLGSSNAHRTSLKHVHEAPPLMGIPLIILAFGSIFLGYMAKDMMIGLGTDFWANAVFTLPQNNLILESEYIPQSVKMIPLFFSLLGAVLAYAINIAFASFTYSFKLQNIPLYTFLNKRWMFDKVYNDFLAYPALSFGYEVSFKTLDKGFIEVIGPSGIAVTIQKLSKQISSVQSGFVYHYAFVMLISLSVFILLVGLWDIISFWMDTRLFFIFAICFLFYTYIPKELAK